MMQCSVAWSPLQQVLLCFSENLLACGDVLSWCWNMHLMNAHFPSSFALSRNGCQNISFGPPLILLFIIYVGCSVSPWSMSLSGSTHGCFESTLGSGECRDEITLIDSAITLHIPDIAYCDLVGDRLDVKWSWNLVDGTECSAWETIIVFLFICFGRVYVWQNRGH